MNYKHPADVWHARLDGNKECCVHCIFSLLTYEQWCEKHDRIPNREQYGAPPLVMNDICCPEFKYSEDHFTNLAIRK